MRAWLFYALVFLLPGGSLLLLLEWLRRRRERERRPDLVRRWGAFIADTPVIVDGAPRFLRANVPDVKPLRAEKEQPANVRLFQGRIGS